MKNNFKIFMLAFTLLLSTGLELLAQGFGIGTASPAEILHVYKNAGNSVVRFQTETGNASTNTGAVTFPAVNATDVAGVGAITWGTPNSGGGAASDGSFATAAAGTSHYLQAVNATTGVPAGATINGVLVEVQKSVSTPVPVTLLNTMVKTATTVNNPPANFTVSSGGTNTNRLLVVVVNFTSPDNTAGYSVNTFTYGGQALTKAASDSKKTGAGGNARTIGTEIWYMKDATITTANLTSTTFAITWNTGNPLNVNFYVSSYKNVYQTTPVTASNANGTTGPLSTAAGFSSLANDYVLWGAASNGTSGTPGTDFTAQAGYTKDFDDEPVNAGNDKLASEVEHKAITVAATETPISTSTQTPARYTIVGINISGFGNVTDNVVSLIVAGAVSGDNKATATVWPQTSATATSTPYVSYGSSSDLWGLALTQGQVTAANFGVAISATVGTNAIASIDHMRITIYYSTASLGTKSFTAGIENSSGNFKLSYSATASTGLGTNDFLTVDGSGNVGIGCTSPAYLLDVRGTLGVSGQITTGSAVVTTGVAACSDFRYKMNIAPLKNSLDNVLKLEGVNYLWRTKEFKERNFSSDLQIGFIAQDIEKIYPQFVMTDEKGFKAVDYSRLTPVLVEAIKEQQKIIEALKDKIYKVSEKAEKAEMDRKQQEYRIIQLENYIKTTPVNTSSK